MIFAGICRCSWLNLGRSTKSLIYLIGTRRNALLRLSKVILTPLSCSRKSQSAPHVLSAMTPARLLSPTIALRLKRNLRAHKNRSNTQRATDLMGGNSQSIYICYLKRNTTKRLNSVSMKKRTHLMRSLSKFYNRLDNTSLIVGIHHRNKSYRLVQKTLKCRSLNLSLTVRLDNSDLKALLAKNRC